MKEKKELTKPNVAEEKENSIKSSPFAVMPKEVIVRAANKLVKDNQEVFDLYFAYQNAMKTNVDIGPDAHKAE